jgi:hypothetical protein
LDISKTAILSDIELHRFVVALLPTIPIPKPLPLSLPRMRPIFVVADETAFALA